MVQANYEIGGTRLESYSGSGHSAPAEFVAEAKKYYEVDIKESEVQHGYAKAVPWHEGGMMIHITMESCRGSRKITFVEK